MSLLTKGITKLSQLEVDADKDWRAREISNLKAVAEAMSHGDIAFRGMDVIEKLTADAGKGYSFLRSRGPGLSPIWQDIESIIQYMTGAQNRAAAIDLALPVPVVAQTTVQASSPPGRMAGPLLGMPQPVIAAETLTGPGGATLATPSLAVPAPQISTGTSTGEPVAGAVADDGGVQTDETVPANNDTVNDMTLLPAVPALDDTYYLGHASLWDWLELRIGTAGNGDWTIVWEYWNGTVWTALPDVNDGTSGFEVSGTRLVTFTRPVDWALITVGGIANLYWIRARISAYTSIVTQPKGTRAFIWIKQ